MHPKIYILLYLDYVLVLILKKVNLDITEAQQNVQGWLTNTHRSNTVATSCGCGQSQRPWCQYQHNAIRLFLVQ